MEQNAKHLYDILLRAEWLDNITEIESKEQKGVFEQVIHFRTGQTMLENGQFRLWLFSKLYRELVNAGMTTSPSEVHPIIAMGTACGIQQGWEKLSK